MENRGIIELIEHLDHNKDVFRSILGPLSEELIHFKSSQDEWSILEVTAHLVDEEVEDFRTRTEYVLASKENPPTFNPESWVEERKYAQKDYLKTLDKFIEEREQSVLWLRSKQEDDWQCGFTHPRFGFFSAQKILSNWVAHDLLHLRQILKIKYNFVQTRMKEDLRYAGIW